MAVAYATQQQIEAQAFKPDAEEWGQIEPLLLAASRFIDRQCRFPEGYFDKASDVASSRTFYGTGTRHLRLPPFVGTIVAANVAFVDTTLTVPPFTVREEYLVADRGYCWDYDEPLTVSARWGFAEIPADITQACIELVIAVWRTADPARERAVSDTSDEQFRIAKVPARVRETIKEWARTRAVVFA